MYIMTKLKFKSFNAIIFYSCFKKLFFNSLIYTKMSKNLSAKYYQENKEKMQKKARERCQNLFKEEKEKKQQYRCQ